MDYTCKVSLAANPGKIRFLVVCMEDDKAVKQGVVDQDMVGITVRRWTYTRTEPFPRIGDINGKPDEYYR